MSVGYRPAPYTVPPARRGCPAAAPRRRRCAGSTGRCCSRCSGCARSAARWSGPRPARPRSSRRRPARRSSRSTCLNIAIGLVLGAGGLGVRLPDAARLRAGALPALDRRAGRGALAAGLHDQRLALVDRAARAASRCSRRSSPRSRWSSAWRCCCPRSATPRTAPRDVDVVLALAFAAVPLALVMLQPDLGTALVVVARSCSAWWRCPARRSAGSSGLVAGRGAARVRGRAGRPAQGLPARPVRRRSTTRPPTPRAPATTSGRPRSRSAPAASTAQGLFHGAQTQGQFVPAQQTDFIFTVAGEELGFVGAGVHRAAAGRRAVAGRPDRDAGRGPVRPAAWRPACSAGSPSRPSRTSA